MNTDSIQQAAGGRRFELVKTLGVGSFGSVYLAEMVSAGGFKRRVALKLLNATWDAGSDASRRLRDEARLLGRLQHRHIVRVDDLLRLDGRWALLMEYVPGIDLESIVAPPQSNTAAHNISPLPLRAALEITAAVSSALRAAAESLDSTGSPLQVVHRDIKPSNIRLTAEAEVKVLDFGVARASFEGREAKTERVRYGSVGYMAPERLLGGDETSAGDVFSLGVVLYELLLQKTYGRSELGPDAQHAQVERGASELKGSLLAAGHTGEHADAVATLFVDLLEYEPESRPSTLQIEERLRALVVALPSGDLGRWCLNNVPALEALSGRGDEAGLTGRVLAESDQGGGPSVNSQTIALPTEPEPEPRSGTLEVPASMPSRAPLLVGAVVGAILVLGLGAWWAVGQLGAGTPDPVANVAAASAPPVATTTPENEPMPTAPGANPSVDAETAAVGPGANPGAVATAPATPVPSPPIPPSLKPVPPRDGALAPRALTDEERAILEGVVNTPLTGVAAPAPEAARLRSAKFVLADSAERIDVSCGDVSSSGSGNALVQSFPAGPCQVRAAGLSTTVTVESPRKVDCSLADGALTCR